jgi:uncharacterized protein YdeI (YjbR/CyaY-like superfamily)
VRRDDHIPQVFPLIFPSQNQSTVLLEAREKNAPCAVVLVCRYTSAIMPTSAAKSTRSAPAKTVAKKAAAVKPSASAGGPNARVDAYIAKAAAFAQPILNDLRALVHEAAPGIQEEMKWSRPFFSMNGHVVAHISAFKEHCGFGFWSPDMTAMLSADGITGDGAAGSFGRITSMKELPPRKDLLRYVKHAASLASSGEATSPVASRPRTSAKAPIAMPPDFAALLGKSKPATATFEGFPPSCKREYLEWITTAKRPETRERRMAEAVTRMAAGRRYNDEYATKK